MKKPKKEEKPLSGAQDAYEWLQILIVALVTIILVFTFVGRIIGVDGSSMYPVHRPEGHPGHRLHRSPAGGHRGAHQGV